MSLFPETMIDDDDDEEDGSDTDGGSSAVTTEMYEDLVKSDLFAGHSLNTTPPRKSSKSYHSNGREQMKTFLRMKPLTNNMKLSSEEQSCMNQLSADSVKMQAPVDSVSFKTSKRLNTDIVHKYTFTQVFGADTKQAEFFRKTVLPAVKDVLDGHNSLVFTYGVTNSGKTYTIQGTPQEPGVLPRTLDIIFNTIGKVYVGCDIKPTMFSGVVQLSPEDVRQEELTKTLLLKSTQEEEILSSAEVTQSSLISDDSISTVHSEQSIATKDYYDMLINHASDRLKEELKIDLNLDKENQYQFSVWLSMAEVYNEMIYDLLEPMTCGRKKRSPSLRLHEDKNGNVYIGGLKEVHVCTSDEAYKLLAIGRKNLHIAATKLNHVSSRSHCIFTLRIVRLADVNQPHVAKISKLSFCDLAGSERYTKTQNTGDRLKEAGNINTSLLTLGKCLYALRYNQQHNKTNAKVVPFRESKLTRLFQNFFTGQGKVSMIINVNQCSTMYDETSHVLKFSAIAKQVMTSSAVEKKAPIIPAVGLRDVRATIAWAHTPRPELDTDLTLPDESCVDTFIEDSTEGVHIQQLENTVNILRTELVKAEVKMAQLETEIRAEVCDEMSRQLVQIERRYNERMIDVEVVQENRWERRYDILAQAYHKLQDKVKQLEGTDDSESSDTECETLKDELSAVKVRNGELERKVGDNEQRLIEQADTVQQLQVCIDDCKNAVTDAEEKLSAKKIELKGTVRLLEEQKSLLIVREEQHGQEVSDLKENMEPTKGSLEQSHKLAESHKLIEQYESYITQLETENKSMSHRFKTEMALSEQQVDKLKESLSLSETETNKLTLKLSEAMKQINQVDDVTSSLQKSNSDIVRVLRTELEASQAEKEHLQLSVTNLTSELRMMSDTITSLSEDKGQLDIQIEFYKSKLGDREEIIEMLQDENESVRMENFELMATNTNLLKNIPTKTENKESTSEDVSQLRASVEEKEFQLCELKIRAEEAENNLCKCKAELEELGGKCLHAETEVDELQAQVDLLQSNENNNKRTITELNENQQNTVTTLNTQLTTLTQQLKSEQQSITESITQVSIISEENKKLTLKLTETVLEKESLQQLNNELQSKLEDEKHCNTNQESQLSTYQSECQNYVSKLEETNKELKNSQLKMDALQRELTDNESKLTELGLDRDRLAEKSLDQCKHADKFQEQMKILTDSLALQDEILEKITVTLNNKEKQITEWKQEITNLKEEIRGMNEGDTQKISNLNEQRLDLEDKLQSETRRRKEVDLQRLELENKLQVTAEKETEALKMVMELQREKDELVDVKNNLQGELDHRVKMMRRDCERELFELREEKETFVSEQDTLRQKNIDITQQLKDTQTRLDQVTCAQTTVKSVTGDTKCNMETLKQQLNIKLKTVENLERGLSAKDRIISDLKETNDRLVGQMRRLQCENKSMRQASLDGGLNVDEIVYTDFSSSDSCRKSSIVETDESTAHNNDDSRNEFHDKRRNPDRPDGKRKKRKSTSVIVKREAAKKMKAAARSRNKVTEEPVPSYVRTPGWEDDDATPVLEPRGKRSVCVATSPHLDESYIDSVEAESQQDDKSQEGGGKKAKLCPTTITEPLLIEPVELVVSPALLKHRLRSRARRT